MFKKRLELDRFRSFSFSRKGQITIFIILGIVILLLAVIIIFVKSESVQFRPDEIVPTEKGKVETFITSCLKQAGDEALLRLGTQGGYIEVPQTISSDANKHLRLSPDLVVPFWAQGTTKEIPSLEQIAADIDGYIEEHVRSCLLQTQVFQESYVIAEKSPLTSTTKILDKNVVFNLHWDVELRTKDGEIVSNVVNHVAQSSVKLKRMHETAQKIIDAELSGLKFEDLTQDLLALEHPNVPLTGFELSCEQKKWKVKEVQDSLKDLLRVNLREVRIEGSNYVQFPEELSYYQNHYVWNVGEGTNANDLAVQFRFEDNYPFVFDVRPRSSAYLMSGQLGASNDLLSSFCVQSWKFVYSLSYPVLVTLEDLESGYTFKLGFTVHLVNNYPQREQVNSKPLSSFALPTTSDEEYCEQRRYPMNILTYSKVDNDRGVSFVDDLDDTKITFSCLQYSCDVGKTEFNFEQFGTGATLRANFPSCAGGIVRAQKPGYKDAWQRVVTTPQKEVSLYLTPLKDISVKNIVVVKHLYNKETQTLGPATPLSGKETALLSLEYGKDPMDPQKAFHETSAILTSLLDERLKVGQNLTLLSEADFTYAAEITVIDAETFGAGFKGNITIPWEELASASKITFHVIETQGASEEDRYDLLLNLEQYSKLVPAVEMQ